MIQLLVQLHMFSCVEVSSARSRKIHKITRRMIYNDIHMHTRIYMYIYFKKKKCLSTYGCESKLGMERSAVFHTYGTSVGFLAVHHHPQHGPKTMGSF
jgi:hypothetical protein